MPDHAFQRTPAASLSFHRQLNSNMHRYWIVLAAISLSGIIVGGYLDRSIPPPVSASMPSLPELAGIAFALLYFLSTLVFAPYHTLAKRYRAVPATIAAGTVTVWPWWSWLVLAPLFAGDGRAKVPGPISATMVILLHWFGAWMVFILCMVASSHFLPTRPNPYAPANRLAACR